MSSAAEVPSPPADIELRNIIDKLAQFVAKNGHEFEQMTKQKQKDNSKFSFLYGGEYFNYYQYRVATEQAIQRKEAATSAFQGPPPSESNALPHAVQMQLRMFEQQVRDSEANLSAQHEALMQQQQAQIEDAIRLGEREKIRALANNAKLNIDEFVPIIEALIRSCSKDNIARSKQWIFTNCESDRLKEILLMYMLARVKDPSAIPESRLHILYLINDWAHHCMRKAQTSITQMLSRYVPKMYAYAVHYAEGSNNDEVKTKLDKLMSLWESQKYFDDNAYKQLRNPTEVYNLSQSAINAEHIHVVNDISQKTQQTYASYQNQHREFIKHINTQSQALQMQHQQPKRRSRFDMTPGGHAPSAVPGGPPSLPPPPFDYPPMMAGGGGRPPFLPPHPQQPYAIPPIAAVVSHPPPPSSFTIPPPGGPAPAAVFPWATGSVPPGAPQVPGGVPQWAPSPQIIRGPVPLIPTGSEERMKSAAVIADERSLIPTAPYYELPAALMVPLVAIDDSGYEPIDPNRLRYPPGVPPTERLLAAVEAFYSPPMHENPRDSDGWERGGLYEYFKAKAAAIEERRKREGKRDPPKETREDKNRKESTSSRSRSSSSGSSSSSSSSSTPSGNK